MTNIYKVARKFLLKLAQDPEVESKLLKHLGPEKNFENPIFKEMINRGIIPIISNRSQRETALLGQGQYNKAYEVSYKGQRAVAKVTQEKSDHDMIRVLHNLKKDVGSDSKYIVNVYDYFETKDPETGAQLYIIVVEPLLPLNSHLREILFEGRTSRSKNPSAFSQIKQDYDYLEIIESMNGFLKNTSAYREVPDKFKILSLEKIDLAFQKAWHASSTVREFQENLRMNLRQVKGPICNLIRSEPAKDPSENWLKENMCYAVEHLCEEVIYGILSKVPLDAQFPYFYTQKTDPNASAFLQKAETKDFLRFLYLLKKEHRISWGDLHQDNIMMRPGSLDLVISDPGLFRVSTRQ